MTAKKRRTYRDVLNERGVPDKAVVTRASLPTPPAPSKALKTGPNKG